MIFNDAVQLGIDGNLSVNSQHWLLENSMGFTVAHRCTFFITLPLDFPHWDLVDPYGNTVAYYAAMYGNLPDGFADKYSNIWNSKGGGDYTVKGIYIKNTQ